METAEEIRVNVSDYILTPLSCSYLIHEILKGLIYQKCQIPYPFSWLKSTINRRRGEESEAECEGLDLKPKTNINFTVEHHYRVASKFFDDFQNAMKEISQELSQNVVSEILILFGPTPVCPKEVCRIKVPLLASGHFEDSHINDALKHQHKALRQIFLSNIWMDSVDSAIPCTNTYIFIKRGDISDNMKYFKPCKPLSFHNNVKVYCINLKWECTRDQTCCKNLVVYNEIPDTNIENSIEPVESKQHEHLWFQFAHHLQGFKNCFINKTAVCELW
ncbi:hypothetical protein WA026_007879 [Henosepilachna vigintioctopunctata]|uniref:Uncharacterized protein n=1 Tax=Henosepilachna vigintioctopunctata TaxID=420089 RepID=A0AAW1TV96_9CUCU